MYHTALLLGYRRLYTVWERSQSVHHTFGKHWMHLVWNLDTVNNEPLAWKENISSDNVGDEH
jgi:hypothetical protein